MIFHSELDKEPSPFGPKIPNPWLYGIIYLTRGLTKANFGRNQLSPVSIGFSPLFLSYTNACPQHRFRLPQGFTPTSPYPGIDRPVSGHIHVTSRTFTRRPSLLAGLLVSLWLPCNKLALPHRYTPWRVFQNAHRDVKPRFSITIRFQVLFTPCHGFFSTFPHGTSTLSVSRRI